MEAAVNSEMAYLFLKYSVHELAIGTQKYCQ